MTKKDQDKAKPDTSARQPADESAEKQPIEPKSAEGSGDASPTQTTNPAQASAPEQTSTDGSAEQASQVKHAQTRATGRAGTGAGIGVLALLLALVAVGVSGWLWWERQKSVDVQVAGESVDLTELHAELSKLQSRHEKLQQELVRLEQTQNLSTPLRQNLPNAVTRSLAQALVTQALFAYSHGEPQTGASNLRAATRLLMQSDEPTLIAMAQSGASLIPALNDYASQHANHIAELMALRARINQLPLKDSLAGRIPNRANAQETSTPDTEAARPGVLQALRQLVVIRHHDQAVAPLLDPEQQRLVHLIMVLRMDELLAQLRMGHTQTQGPVTVTRQAALDWLQAHYALSQDAVGQARQLLARPLPDTNALQQLSDWRHAIMPVEEGAGPASSEPANNPDQADPP